MLAKNKLVLIMIVLVYSYFVFVAGIIFTEQIKANPCKVDIGTPLRESAPIQQPRQEFYNELNPAPKR